MTVNELCDAIQKVIDAKHDHSRTVDEIKQICDIARDKVPAEPKPKRSKAKKAEKKGD